MSMSLNVFDFKKATQALNYFAIKEGGKINKMKALKLVWLSERLHLRKFGRPIINDIYYAMKLGPVPSVTKDIAEGRLDEEEEIMYRNTYLELDGYVINSKSDTQDIVFSKSDLNVMNEIYNEYYKFNHFQLSDLSHNFPEWKKFESHFSFGARFQMSYLDFFLNSSNNDSIFNQDNDFLLESKDFFIGEC